MNFLNIPLRLKQLNDQVPYLAQFSDCPRERWTLLTWSSCSMENCIWDASKRRFISSICLEESTGMHDTPKITRMWSASYRLRRTVRPWQSKTLSWDLGGWAAWLALQRARNPNLRIFLLSSRLLSEFTVLRFLFVNLCFVRASRDHPSASLTLSGAAIGAILPKSLITCTRLNLARRSSMALMGKRGTYLMISNPSKSSPSDGSGLSWTVGWAAAA